jgi:hypothetical protein
MALYQSDVPETDVHRRFGTLTKPPANILEVPLELRERSTRA